MILDDATLMAYADGELDLVTAEHVERALADDPALAARVARERALRERLAGAFAPIAAEPVPVALTARLANNVVPFPRRTSTRRRWAEGVAIAATLVVGIAVGRQWESSPLTVDGDRLAARGALVASLDRDLSGATGATGATRIVASFRATDGGYCRIFATNAVDGIACRAGGGWTVRRAQSAPPAGRTAYRQAASPVAALMAEAQAMMAGEPLDPQAERAARDHRWETERPHPSKR